MKRNLPFFCVALVMILTFAAMTSCTATGRIEDAVEEFNKDCPKDGGHFTMKGATVEDHNIVFTIEVEDNTFSASETSDRLLKTLKASIMNASAGIIPDCIDAQYSIVIRLKNKKNGATNEVVVTPDEMNE